MSGGGGGNVTVAELAGYRCAVSQWSGACSRGRAMLVATAAARSLHRA